MSNPLQLPLQKLYGTFSGEIYMQAADLAALQDHTDSQVCIENILTEAIELLKQEAASTLEITERKVLQMQEEAQLSIQSQIEHSRIAAVNDAVKWMCDELQLEKEIAKELNRRWHTFTAQILKEVFEQADLDQLMLRRIENRVTELLASGRITLSVPSSLFNETKNQWANFTDVNVISDSTLNNGQAILDNGLVRIHLDVPSQLEHLIKQLQATAEGRQYAD